MQIKNILVAALLSSMPFAASAGVYTALVNGAPGSTVTLNVTFAGDGATQETDASFNFSNTNITITNPVPSASAQCFVVSPTRIRVVPPSGGGTPLTSTATTYCSFSVAIAPAAPEALIPFTVFAIECLNGAAGNESCTLAAGAGVNVQNQPVPRTLSYNPAVGSTVTFAAGMTPGAAAPPQNIAVTAAGTAGTPTLSGCAITGTGASSFNVTPSSLSFPMSNSQNLVVGCTYPTANASATLTCTEIDGDTASPGAPRAFQLACPAPNVNPTVTSPTPTAITVGGGLVGTQSGGTIDLSATGGSGAGSTQVSCTSTGTVLIAASPNTPSGTGPVVQNVTVGQPTDIRFGVLLTANAQAPAGTVVCTVAGQPTLTFTIGAPAGTTSIPPTFIPSSSTWSTLALLSLLGVFGLLAVAFRRQA